MVAGGAANKSDDKNGGNIKVNSDATLILRQSVVERGFADGDGGGIWVGSGGKLEIYGSELTINQAKKNGGGVALASAAKLKISDVVNNGQITKSMFFSNSTLHFGRRWWGRLAERHRERFLPD